MQIELMPWAAVIGFTSVAVSIDLRTRRIPNWLTVTTAIAGLAYHVAAFGWAGLATSLSGFATGFGILLVLWLIGSGGGGDVKLMGAVGAWLGAWPTLLVFIGSGLFAVVCATAMVAWNACRSGWRARRESQRKESLLWHTIPYALPVALSIWALFAFQLLSS